VSASSRQCTSDEQREKHSPNSSTAIGIVVALELGTGDPDGIYYGAGGYYDPLPGRYYGGVRITGVPRDAQVFADGYYVGLVSDFDGVFQHMNLEAGPHHIEIDWGGYEPIAFDVYVRPGETTTFRGDRYFRRY